jgi:hypothetical protein
MGYTHYWYQKRDATPAEWIAILDAARAIISESGDVKLAREYDDPDEAPPLSVDEIRFNGVGENGHETFLLERFKQAPRIPVPDGSTFAFCKTAHKPYDVVVCAILLMANYHAPDVWRISSDGDADAWMPGKRRAYAATGVPAAIPLTDETE